MKSAPVAVRIELVPRMMRTATASIHIDRSGTNAQPLHAAIFSDMEVRMVSWQ
jgi:hypothetical protein